MVYGYHGNKNIEYIMDSEMIWESLKFPNWESEAVGFTWPESGKLIEPSLKN